MQDSLWLLGVGFVLGGAGLSLGLRAWVNARNRSRALPLWLAAAEPRLANTKTLSPPMLLAAFALRGESHERCQVQIVGHFSWSKFVGWWGWWTTLRVDAPALSGLRVAPRTPLHQNFFEQWLITSATWKARGGPFSILVDDEPELEGEGWVLGLGRLSGQAAVIAALEAPGSVRLFAGGRAMIADGTLHVSRRGRLSQADMEAWLDDALGLVEGLQKR